MKNDLKISICSIAYLGYSLEDIFKQLNKMGFGFVELSFIEKYDSTYDDNFFTSESARNINRLLSIYKLGCSVLSSHMDLGLDNSYNIFKKRIEFAAEIGAKAVITNSSSKDKLKSFIENINSLSAVAEKNNVLILLENPGDGSNNLFGNGKEGLELISKINSAFVKINFDPLNIYTYSKGNIDPVAELDYIIDLSEHFHLKNIINIGNSYNFTSINDKLINYSDILNRIYSVKKDDLSLSIELPLRAHFSSNFDFISHPLMPLLNIDSVNDILCKSLKYIKESLFTI